MWASVTDYSTSGFRLRLLGDVFCLGDWRRRSAGRGLLLKAGLVAGCGGGLLCRDSRRGLGCRQARDYRLRVEKNEAQGQPVRMNVMIYSDISDNMTGQFTYVQGQRIGVAS